MPELPEVETTRAGIAPHISGRRVHQVVVREKRLRWPVSAALSRELPGQRVHEISRRAKYLLLRADTGTIIMHLGMSGSVRILTRSVEPLAHDHVDICFASGALRSSAGKRSAGRNGSGRIMTLRFNDPRRFGCILWTRRDPLRHPLLRDLGPEPLSDDFDAAGLYSISRGRKVAIKNFIMNAHNVVGVGNIYASEALFLAGIHPRRPAGRISLVRYEALTKQIRKVLKAAIRAGGTTLRDFTDSDGVPGYFAHSLRVYDRSGKPCTRCSSPVRQEVIGQRSTFFCPRCQR